LLVLDARGGITALDPRTLEQMAAWSVAGPANSIACSPDSQTVAVSFGSWLSEDGWVECWSIAEQRKLASYPASGPVGAARFAPDGGLLVIGGWNGWVAWRTLPRGELLAERQLSKEVVSNSAFSPDAAALPLEPPPEPPRTEFLPQAVMELPRDMQTAPR
jgi:WD40 repeat protein